MCIVTLNVFHTGQLMDPWTMASADTRLIANKIMPYFGIPAIPKKEQVVAS